MNQEVRDRLYRERSERLAKLIRLEAPEPIVYSAAQNLLLTQFQGKRLPLLRFVLVVLRGKISFAIGALCVRFSMWKLMRQGWSRECATDINLGDDPRNHKKIGCKCNEEMRDIESALRDKLKGV